MSYFIFTFCLAVLFMWFLEKQGVENVYKRALIAFSLTMVICFLLEAIQFFYEWYMINLILSNY